MNQWKRMALTVVAVMLLASASTMAAQAKPAGKAAAPQANLGSDCETVINEQIHRDHADAASLMFEDKKTTHAGPTDDWIHGEGSFVADGGTLKYPFSFRCDQNPENKQVFVAWYKVNGGKGVPVKKGAAKPAAGATGTAGAPAAGTGAAKAEMGTAAGAGTPPAAHTNCQAELTPRLRKLHPDATDVHVSKSTRVGDVLHVEGTFVADGGEKKYPFTWECNPNTSPEQSSNPIPGIGIIVKSNGPRKGK